MKHIITKAISFILILIIALGTLTACHKKETASTDTVQAEKTMLVIVVENCANVRKITEDMLDTAKQYIAETVETKRTASGITSTLNVRVIVSDGDPREVSLTKSGRDLTSVTSGSVKDLNTKTTASLNNIVSFLTSDECKGDDEETDLLLSLSRAQDILNEDQYSKYSHKMLVLHTGFSTAGAFNMAKTNVFAIENSDYINSIRNYIPNFTGTTITMLGVGNVGGTQKPITSPTDKDKFETLLTDILTTGGAELGCPINYVDSANTEEMLYTEEGTGYKYVSPAIVPVNVEVDEYIGVPFSAAELGFKADSCELRDIQLVYNLIDTIENQLNYYRKNSDGKIYVVGSIARMTEGVTVPYSELAESRATVIAEILSERYGFPMDRIVIISAVDTEFSWRNANEYPGGEWDDTIAQKNRVVAVISENNTVIVDELRAAGYVN